MRPISPSPDTTTVSPSVGWMRRMPCSAMAPSTVKAALSSSTASGTRAQRFFGTTTASACLPFETTRSLTAKPVTPAPHLEHPPDVAVAECQRLVELALHGLERGRHPVRAHLLEHLPHFVRLLAHLVDERAAAEVHQHPLRAGRDQRHRGGRSAASRWRRPGRVPRPPWSGRS